MVVDDEPGKRRIRRPQQKYVPLSKEAKAAGIKWLMMDGVRTAKEARKLERIFVEDVLKIKGYETQLRDYGIVDPYIVGKIIETCQHSGFNVDEGLARVSKSIDTVLNPAGVDETDPYRPYAVMRGVLCAMGVDAEKAEEISQRAYHFEINKERIMASLGERSKGK